MSKDDRRALVRFSRRLVWGQPENALSRLQTTLQEAAAAGGRPLLDLTVTNPTLVGLAPPADQLAQALTDAQLPVYEPTALGLLTARQAVADDYARRGAAVQPTQIALTASSSESYGLLFKLLADPGDVVLVPAPSYPLFDYLARLEGVVPRPYQLAYDGGWHIDFDSLDLQGVRAICVVNPNNPTGSFISGADWERLNAIAATAGLPLIVDEVFADYPLAPGPDAVPVVAAQRAQALTFCLGGLSKAAALPQLKLGWIAAVGPWPLVSEALERLTLVLDTYLSVGAVPQRALPRLLQLGGALRAQTLARVQQNRRYIAAALGTASPCTLLPTEAGWSAVLRVPEVISDEEWALRLADEDRVLVQPGYYYDLALGATLVLSLIVPPATLAAGVDRIVARAAAL